MHIDQSVDRNWYQIYQIFQTRDATIDVEVRNLDSLLDDWKELHGDFHKILTKAQHLAGACGITPELIHLRQTKRSTDDLTRRKSFGGTFFYPFLTVSLLKWIQDLMWLNRSTVHSNSCGCTQTLVKTILFPHQRIWLKYTLQMFQRKSCPEK